MAEQPASGTGQHTPDSCNEPWKQLQSVDAPVIVDAQMHIVGQERGSRIVACVNACAGIPTKALEGMGLGYWLAATQGLKLIQVETERDTLREEKALLLAALGVQADAWDVLVQTGLRDTMTNTEV